MANNKIIVTAALPYANGFLHLGHIASTYLPSHIFATYLKLKHGKDAVIYVSATDEHGTPIEINASKFSLDPEEYVKIFRKEHKNDLKKVGIEFDSFHYTHSEENKKIVYEFYEKAKQKGLIYEKDVDALYCENCERFLPDRYVKGTCPYCGAQDQYGDVCESCGKTYHATELKNPYCVLCHNPPIMSSTKHVFFALSKLEKDVKFYLENNAHLQDDAKNYALSWLKEGLKDIDITRDAPYFGFPIPDKENKFFYVWVDAPFGYVASTLAYDKNAEAYWKSMNTKIYHFIGKDIVYFHYIYWVAMLLTADYQLPYDMPTRGYLTLNKKKMSKSRGNFVYLRDLAEFLDSSYIRYYFARSIPDTIVDGDFSYDVFKDKVNKELVGIIANLGYRMLHILSKLSGFEYGEVDFSNRDEMKHYEQVLDKARVKEGLEFVLDYAVKVNEKFNAYEPWKLVKENKGKEKIKELAEDVLLMFAMLEPYVPALSKKYYDFANVVRSSFYGFKSNGAVEKIGHLIERIDDDLFNFISGKDDFAMLDLRIGKIVEVKDHPNADKLYIMRIDAGELGVKQIVGGLKAYYSKDELLGKKVVFVNNLKPAKLRGELSEGMLLAASSNDGKIVGLSFVEDPRILPGSEVTIKGMFRKPKKEISIDAFRKIELIKEGEHVFYKGHRLIARSLCHEEPLKVDRATKIEDGAKLW